MIKIVINEQSREWDNSLAGWVNGTIKELERDGTPICVKVSIEYGDINLGLSAGSCPGGTSGGRPLNSHELELVKFWNEVGVDESPLNGGKIVSFLNRVKSR